MGIHDLLEQSISRSGLYSGANNNSADTLQAKRLSRPSSRAATTSQTKQSSTNVANTLQASVSQVATPRASTSSWEEDGGLRDADRTAVPERRQLKYFGSSSKAATTHSKAGKRSASGQVVCYQSNDHLC